MIVERGADGIAGMKKSGTILGFLALALALASGALWFYLARQVDIPENRTIFVVVFLSAVALGVWTRPRTTSGVPARKSFWPPCKHI